MGKKPHQEKRGHSIGLILSFDSMNAYIWKIFSGRSQLFAKVKLGRKFENATNSHLYPFYEEVVNSLRKIIQEGNKSILLVSPAKTNYARNFLDHIKSHHQWMLKEKSTNSVKIQELSGNISNDEGLAYFLQSQEYKDVIESVVEGEVEDILQILEKRLNDKDNGLVLFTISEIEKLVFAGGIRKKKFKPLKLEPEYIILTNNYIENSKEKSRIHHLLQIAQNRTIRSKIVDIDSSVTEYLDRLGGIVCFLKTNSEFERELADRLIE